MLEQRLIYRGNGTYQTATRFDLALAEQTFKPGENVAGRIGRERSVRQNNTFHKMIQYAHDNQRAGPMLPTWEHLKKWLLIRAGHYSERRFEVPSIAVEEARSLGTALAYFLRSRDEYVGVAYDPATSEFVERTAKSVRFTAVMSDEMKALFDRIAHIICEEIVPGLEPEALIEHVKASCRSGQRRKAA